MEMIIIKPYNGAGSIAFGMNVEEVTALIGNPNSSTKNRRGEVILRYDDMYLTFSNRGVVEVELLSKSNPQLDGIAIFSDHHALWKLCTIDGDPKECLGAIILMNLGVSLTGFPSQEDSQKSVSVFARGRFDILKSQMEPFSRPV